MTLDKGIIFALLSLFFAGINDVVFKKYAVKIRSRGMYVCGMGVVWTASQFIYMRTTSMQFSLDQTTLVYGAIAGLLLTLANILLIESLAHIHVSLGSTVYRLNTIGVVVLAVILLNEPPGACKLSGIAIGIVSVLLLYDSSRVDSERNIYTAFFMMAVMASLFRALYGIVSKIALLSGADLGSMLLVIAVSWIVGGSAYALLRERTVRVTKKTWVYSAVSGVLVFVIASFLMLALNYGEASIVIPVANMSFVLALLVSVLLKMETLTLKKAVSILLAAVSIILLAKV